MSHLPTLAHFRSLIAGNSRMSSSFEALKSRNYRWFWFGRVAVSAGFEMSMIAQGWLVYQLTGSAFALSWVGTGRSIAMFLLSPYGGVICDRTEKRSLLIWTRVAVILNLIVVTLLIVRGRVQLWHLAASALLAGIFYAFMMPAQSTIVADLVDRKTLLNAISLNSIGMGLTAILADSATGYLLDWVGVAGAYAAMVALNIFALFAVYKLPKTRISNGARRSVWLDLREGLRYLLAQRTLLAIVALVIVRVLFIMPYRTFMPKFTSEVMGLDAAGLGLLMAASSVGSLISSFSVASSGDYRGKGKLLLVGGAIAGISLIFLVMTRSVPLAFLILIFVGAANSVCIITGSTLLQANCAPEFRGRVMGVDMMVWGLAPLGMLPAGALADRIGVAPVIGLQGALALLCFLALAFLTPRLRQLA